MKRFLLPILTLIVTLGLVATAEAKPVKGTKFAQQGKFAIGMATGIGGLGSGAGWQMMSYTPEVSGTEGDSVDTSSLIFNPTVDYFVIDGLAVGLQPIFGMTSQDDYESTTMGIALRVNYYYRAMGSVFLYGGGAFGFGSTTVDVDGSDEAETGFKGFDIGAGAALAFGGKFGGFGSLGLAYTYNMLNPDGPVEATDAGFGIRAGIGIYF